ncbi:Protein SGT1 A [Mortierella sp. 14UC]|nr:Protein SGT1 A [Mortierella sp. 14UC]
MTTAQDLFAQGSHAFAEDDYEEALSFYSQAIEVNGTHAEIFLKRSATYQKLGKDKEAYEDAVHALELIKEKPSSDVTVEAKAQLRKGVAAFHLQDYQTAKVALEACQTLSPEQRTLASWIRKNEQELAKLPKAAVTAAPATVAATAAASAADVTPVVSAVASPASTPVTAPLTPAAHRVRHEWYQNDTFVTISVFIKNVKKDAVEIIFTDRALSVSVKMPTGSDYSLELDPLSHKVIPSESKYEVLSTKIEIQLKKEVFAIKWGALEGDDVNAGSMAAIYKDADDDTRRAMMKSFTESNGTCLSTNWDEVGKGTVETRPPEGMVAKKYSS